MTVKSKARQAARQYKCLPFVVRQQFARHLVRSGSFQAGEFLKSKGYHEYVDTFVDLNNNPQYKVSLVDQDNVVFFTYWV